MAYRRGGVEVCGRRFDEGAFIYFVPSCAELSSVPPQEWGVDRVRLLSDTRVLDVLLQNSDRHLGHFQHGEHWVARDARPGRHAHGAKRPVLIDHAAGFRADAFVSMEHENAFQTGPVRSVAARTYLRLRFLDAAAIANKFSGVLTEREMRALLARRNRASSLSLTPRPTAA